MERLPKEFIEAYECAMLGSLCRQNAITEEQYEWCMKELQSQPGDPYSYSGVASDEGCSIL